MATIGLAALGMVATTGFNLTHMQDQHREEAAAWFAQQSPQAQKQLQETASALHMNVDDYLVTFKICGSERPSNKGKATNQSLPAPAQQ